MLKYIKKIIASFLQPTHSINWWIISSIITLYAIFYSLGYFDSIIKILDSELLTFRFATISFSLYKVIKSIFLLVVFFWLAQFTNKIVEINIKKLSRIQDTTRAILTQISKVFVYFIFLIMILDMHGIDLSAFAFLGGAVGIGVGLGLQKIASNFISGLILLFEQSVKKGDLIEISTGASGLVKYTGVRYTLIEAPNGQEIMIPNDELITNRVSSWTHTNNNGRIEIKIGVSYDTDIEKACKLMVQAATDNINCSHSKSPKCYVVNFADNSIELLLLFWLEDVNYGRLSTKSVVMENILSSFRDNNIIIPFPQYDVNIKRQNS